MHVGGVMNGRDGLCRGLLTAATPYFLLPAASSFQLPTSYFQLPTSYLLITTCPREESLSLAPVRAPVAVQVKVDVEPEAISSNSLHAHCMLTACSLHADCMLTACLLHAHCMLTACLLHAYCMLTACLLHAYCMLLQATYGAELSTAGTGPVSVSRGRWAPSRRVA